MYHISLALLMSSQSLPFSSSKSCARVYFFFTCLQSCNIWPTSRRSLLSSSISCFPSQFDCWTNSWNSSPTSNLDVTSSGRLSPKFWIADLSILTCWITSVLSLFSWSRERDSSLRDSLFLADWETRSFSVRSVLSSRAYTNIKYIYDRKAIVITLVWVPLPWLEPTSKH